MAGGGGEGVSMCTIEYGECLSSLVTLNSSEVIGGITTAAHLHPFSSLSSSVSLVFASAVVVVTTDVATSVVTSSDRIEMSDRSRSDCSPHL